MITSYKALYEFARILDISYRANVLIELERKIGKDSICVTICTNCDG